MRCISKDSGCFVRVVWTALCAFSVSVGCLFFAQQSFAHGFPAPMGGGMMAPPAGGMMPHTPMVSPRGGVMPPPPPPHGGGTPGAHGASPYPGYGAYGRGNPWWGESYMDGWAMMPWMMGQGRSSEGSGQSNSTSTSQQPSTGYGSAWGGDYGQYVPTQGHVMPPRSDPGSDATSMFNCHDGYFYDSLTEKCEKQQQ